MTGVGFEAVLVVLQGLHTPDGAGGVGDPFRDTPPIPHPDPVGSCDGRMAEDHTLFNPGPLPLVFDNAGHVVDPQDRVTANPNSVVVKGLVASGLLVDQGPASTPEPPPPTTEDPETAPDPEPAEVVVEDGD